jgi:hypothetical protein
MNANLPKYMSIGDFCAYSGYSRYQFMRLADKANLPVKQLGRFKLIDVQQALAAFENLPDAVKEVPVNLQPRKSPPGRIESQYQDGGVDELRGETPS